VTQYYQGDTSGIPGRYCPFLFSVSPHFERLEEEGLSWAKRFNLLSTEAAIRRFSGARYGLLAAMVHPTTDLEELLLISKWHMWLFLYDDQFDEGASGKDGEAIESVVDHLLCVLTDDRACPRGALAESLAFLWQELRRHSSPSWQRNYSRNVADTFRSYTWEIGNRIQKRIPHLHEYVENRQKTGAVKTAFDMIEIAHRLHLPEWIYECPQFQDLQRIAVNIVCWHNDLSSLDKELARGDVHNLVLVMQKEKNCPLQQAKALAGRMCDEEVRLFIEKERNFPSFTPEIDQDLRLYILGLRHWVRGNLEWNHYTGRYADVEDAVPGQDVSYLEHLLPM
jgi:5-epi-alpha-selinene synthase